MEVQPAGLEEQSRAADALILAEQRADGPGVSKMHYTDKIANPAIDFPPIGYAVRVEMEFDEDEARGLEMAARLCGRTVPGLLRALASCVDDSIRRLTTGSMGTVRDDTIGATVVDLWELTMITTGRDSILNGARVLPLATADDIEGGTE